MSRRDFFQLFCMLYLLLINRKCAKKHKYLTLYQNWNRAPVHFELVDMPHTYTFYFQHPLQPGASQCKISSEWEELNKLICQGLEVNHIKISMIIDDNQNINALYVFIWEFFSVDVIEIVIENHFFFTKVTGKTVSGKGVTSGHWPPCAIFAGLLGHSGWNNERKVPGLEIDYLTNASNLKTCTTARKQDWGVNILSDNQRWRNENKQRNICTQKFCTKNTQQIHLFSVIIQLFQNCL